MSFLDSVFGAKPQIAPYTGPTTLGPEQIKALEADLAAWPQIQQIANLWQSQYLGELNQAIPGFSDILAMGGQTTQEMQKQALSLEQGQIPQDVQDAVQRSSAFQNLLSGGGGGMAQANTARDFGLTSLNLIQEGGQLAGQAGNAAQQWANLSGAAQAGQVAAGQLITPQQQAQFDQQTALIEQAVQQARNNVAAAPNPALQALNQWVEQVGGSVVSSYLGGRGGNFATSYNANQYGTGLSGNAANVVYGGQTGSGYLGSGAQAQPSDISSPGYFLPSSSTPSSLNAAPGIPNNQFALPTASSSQQSYNPFSDYLTQQSFQQSNFPTDNNPNYFNFMG